MNSLFNRNPGAGGVFARLRGNHAGNTLAMMAIGMIPLAGLVGGAVDMSRIYLTKTRLQQACDAGVLAGRKVMGGGTWSASSNAANTAALQFFDGNFKSGAYGTTDRTRAYTESAGKVSGSASAKVPMTMMKIFRIGDETVSVACEAEMRLPNTDIMFVLDTTGSMASKASSNDSETKIVGLRKAVKCFYEILARLDTNAVCGTGAGPSGGTGTQVQIRFGFMPYATNVNVGKLLPTNWFADAWPYQTRKQDGAWGWTDFYYDKLTYPNGNGNCPAQTSSDITKVKFQATKIWNNNYGWVCYHERQEYGPKWKYMKDIVDVSGLKNGAVWRNSFLAPIANDGSNSTINWDGCIEERDTVPQLSYSPIPSGAKDLDIDTIPSISNPGSLWGPALPGLIFARDVKAVNGSWNELETPPAHTHNRFYNNVPYYCPAEAKKLQKWPAASAFESYVDGLNPDGNTYHDIGMLWGARFISPTGLFRSENEFTPQGGEIERHMIFMTDGDTVANNTDYAAYGFPWLDRRTANPADDEGEVDSAFVNQVNARFEALCTAVKNKNITVWVVSFGDGNNATTKNRLRNCSTDNDTTDNQYPYFFQADESDDLVAAFRKIADKISQLRLTN